MTPAISSNIQMTQGYEVLAPRSGKAYPVPCDEWAFLKDKLISVSTPPWILPATSFTLLGAALATFISILVGGVTAGESGKGIIIAWAVVVVTGIIGIACLALSFQQQKIQRIQVDHVLRQMDLIEKRFESNTA
jgi:hypothetical protein